MALNMLMRSYAACAGGSRSLLLMCPGWVRTDMAGPNATLDVETSTRGIADTIAAQAGLRYMDYQGRAVPWYANWCLSADRDAPFANG